MKTTECLCLGTIGLIVTPWKFDVLKTSIFALEASLLGEIFVLKNIKFPWGNYQPIVPRKSNFALEFNNSTTLPRKVEECGGYTPVLIPHLMGEQDIERKTQNGINILVLAHINIWYWLQL